MVQAAEVTCLELITLEDHHRRLLVTSLLQTETQNKKTKADKVLPVGVQLEVLNGKFDIATPALTTKLLPLNYPDIQL